MSVDDIMSQLKDGEELMFSYGTLKPGFPNASYLPPGARFLHNGITVDSFPLVVALDTRVPFLLALSDHPGAYRVKGVLFAADKPSIHFLDQFEGVNIGFYERKSIDVRTSNGEVVKASVYFRHPDEKGPDWARKWTIKKLGQLDTIEEYTRQHMIGFIKRGERSC